MHKAFLAGVAAVVMAMPTGSVAKDATTAEVGTMLVYPKTETVSVVDEQFGVKVADPYRWLEDDVRNSKKVADWVAAQKAVADPYLDSLPGKDVLAARMKTLFDYERFSLPQKAGGYYFFTKNDGLQNQSPLYVRKGLKGKDRLLIDPNLWAKDGATALDQWEPSPNGKLLAYAIQDGGSDWRTIRVLDTTTGKNIGADIKWAKFTNIAWVGNEGFLYSRFAEPAKGQEFQALNENQTLYFHRIGTAQAEDRAVYATPDRPKLGHSAQVTYDNRWVLITSAEGTDDKYELNLIDLGKGKKVKSLDQWKVTPLVKGLDHDWQLVEGMGDKLWFVTNKGAPKLKVVQADISGKEPIFTDVVAERTDTLSRAQIVGTRLVLSYLKDAATRAVVLSLNGEPVQQISLNSIGTASGFSGKPGDPETFYSFSSFNQPGAIYRFDSNSGKSTPFVQPKLSFDPGQISIEQRFYSSKDGTKVPMFIVHKKGLDLSKGAPTLLYAYGGFNLPQLPGYSPTRMAWIQSGGVFVLANIRGGSEYGKAWHDAGRLLNKQNVFDDFIAAGEYLIKEGITTKDKLAIEGRSNGGLLVGAVVNQRPDLFAAGHAAVGVMDMLRFDRFTAGRYWVDDYGYPNREADFKNLYRYSPYHNIKSGVDYPAVIVSTADTDDRVVPGHSFKYTAALQAVDTGMAPKIIRIETRAGHGSGKPTDKLIEEYSEIYAFLAKWTGLELR
ncbi:MAG: S9 family peptidase [Sphingomonadaceae bacterium]|nr:S9 family peptidase [Sphingomonadaceae bacterium]